MTSRATYTDRIVTRGNVWVVAAFTLACVGALGCRSKSDGSDASLPSIDATPPRAQPVSSSSLPRPEIYPILYPPPVDAGIDDVTGSRRRLPIKRLRTAKGDFAAWIQPDHGETSLVLVGYEKKLGELATPATVVRRASGRVIAVDAIALARPTDGGTAEQDIALAWVSDLPSYKGQTVDLVYANEDLTRFTAPPIRVATIHASLAQRRLEHADVRVAPNPRGGLVVVHEGPPARCPREGSDADTEACDGFEVKRITTDGTIEPLGAAKSTSSVADCELTDLDGRGLLLHSSSMAIVVPYASGEAAPAFDLPVAYGDYAYSQEFIGGTRGELVALNTNWGDRSPLAAACAKPSARYKPRCVHIGVTGTNGRVLTPKNGAAMVLRVECTDGRPKVTFAGGSVTLSSYSSNLRDFLPTPWCGTPPPWSVSGDP